MGYKIIDVDYSKIYKMRSGTNGFQPKFITDDNKYFVKCQAELECTLRNDWRVEDIATRICKQLKIYSTDQKPCNIRIHRGEQIKTRMGVYAPNYEADGYRFMSFKRLCEINNFQIDYEMYYKMNINDKLRLLINIISTNSGLSLNSIKSYIFDMTIVDILVGNTDRHIRNFGVFQKNNKYYRAMLFDFGLGLFEQDKIYDNNNNYEQCLSSVYMEPTCEHVSTILKQLSYNSDFRMYLKTINFTNLNIDKKLFIHPCSFKYFKEMKKRLEDMKNVIYV